MATQEAAYESAMRLIFEHRIKGEVLVALVEDCLCHIGLDAAREALNAILDKAATHSME